MPLGALASLKSSQLISRHYTYSSLNGEDEFPTYSSLCQSDDDEGQGHGGTIFDDKLELKDFEISSVWSPIRAFGSKLMISSTMSSELDNNCSSGSRSDDDDPDDESWWYAMSLENLLTNTSCYQSFYPKCFYRRRCWRKVIKHKFDSILSFSRIHSVFDPKLMSPRHQKQQQRQQQGQNVSSLPFAESTTLSWEWKWNEVSDIQVISPTVLRFRTFGDQLRTFEVDPCPAHYLETIFHIHKLLFPARNLVSSHISPATNRYRYHCNRIDSSGYISLITDTRQDLQDQRKIQDSIEKLRELIEEKTIAMIPNLDPQAMAMTKGSQDGVGVNLSFYRTHQHLSSQDLERDCETHLTKNSQPTLLTIRFPEKNSAVPQSQGGRSHHDANIPMFVVERMVGYYRLVSGYTQHGSLLSQTPLQFSTAVPSLAHSATAVTTRQKKSLSYLPNELFAHRDSPEPTRDTLWTILEDDPDNNSGLYSKSPLPAFYLPAYSTQDCLSHIHKLMRVAENSILCLQKYLFFDPSSSPSVECLEKCEVRYQQTLSGYANDCVYKAVSIIRSMVIWNVPESHTNRLGPWSEEYMPFTRYVLRNNLRLMYSLLAVSTTSPFRINRIPCFSRYIGIRSLVIWEMRNRVLSLFDWIKALRNGSLFRLLEVQ
jgi:hypothetical protein